MAIDGLSKRSEFVEWLKEERISEGLVLVNNSFIFRQKIKTNKSSYYLAIPLDAAGTLDLKHPKVASGISFNTDFKFLSAKAKNQPTLEALPEAIEHELQKLGSIVMVLVADVLNTVVTTEPIAHSIYTGITLDPKSKNELAIHGTTITINSAADDEAIWDRLGDVSGQRPPDDLADPLAAALENIRRKHYALLKLPTGSTPSHPLIDSFVEALRENTTRYKKALGESKGLPTPQTNEFNDLLRIAYNFASDAVLVLRLLISVCDLKPVVRWCTVDEWFRLADAFRTLPWSKLKQKPSLDTYQQTINAARNRAFHRLLPVDNTLRLEIEGKTLGTVTLRLFPEYLTRRAEENLDYEDRALVEILADFTRVGERTVSSDFWQRNLLVMETTIDLLARTSIALKHLAKATQ